MEISTGSVINATPDNIGAVLTDFDKYHGLNSFIKHVKGLVKAVNPVSGLLLLFKKIWFVMTD